MAAPTDRQIDRVELRPGYAISRWIHGGWQLSEGHGTAVDRGDAVDALLRLVDAGVTTFDGADIYVGVESLYGELAQCWRQRGGDRDDLQIHTKVVPDLADLEHLRRADIDAILDDSLRRLGVEWLDLVQLHWWDWTIPGWLEAFGWLDDARRAGKVRHLAVTNFDHHHLGQLLDAGFDIVANQVQHSLLDRRPESRLESLCREHRVHQLAYGTLAGGFLVERWRGQDDPGDALANRSLVKYRLIVDEIGGWSALQTLLGVLAEVGRKHGVSAANVAVRWALDRPGVAAVIVGGRNDDHRRDNRRLFNLRLDDEDRAAIDTVLGRLRQPEGDVYSLERRPGGRHAVIMKTDLHHRDR